MRVYRIMSIEEFKEFINKETLISSSKASILTSNYFLRNIHDIELLGYEHDDVICEFEIDESVLENETRSVEIEYKRNTYTQDIMTYQVSKYDSQMIKLTNCILPDFFEYLEEVKVDFDFEIEYWQGIREELAQYSPEQRLRYDEDFSNVYSGAKLFEINDEELKKIISKRLDTSEITTEVLGCLEERMEQVQFDRFLENIDILNFINQFDYKVLLEELKIQEFNVVDELDREEYYLLNGHYPEDEQEKYNFEFEDEDSYFFDEEDDEYMHTPAEIVEGISPREGEIQEVLGETIQNKINEKSETVEKPGEEQGDN